MSAVADLEAIARSLEQDAEYDDFVGNHCQATDRRQRAQSLRQQANLLRAPEPPTPDEPRQP